MPRRGRVYMVIALGGVPLIGADRMEELREAGFEPTCRGEAEQGRTWSGEQLYCNECGEVIQPVLEHQCKKERGQSRALKKSDTTRRKRLTKS